MRNLLSGLLRFVRSMLWCLGSGAFWVSDGSRSKVYIRGLRFGSVRLDLIGR